MSRIDFESIPFIQARWFTRTDGRTRRKIVLHSMEAPEKGDTAEAVARYFQTLPITRKASAHYCVDSNSVVQCVQTKDVAYAAPGANHDGIHIELAGYARQKRSEWEDPYSLAMLEITAELCRFLTSRFGIPVVFLPAETLKKNAEARGFTTHAQVTAAFHRSTHTDPGAGFPMDWLLNRVRNP